MFMPTNPVILAQVREEDDGSQKKGEMMDKFLMREQ